MEDKKFLVVELDGASWNVMTPLLRQGKLPNIQRLIDNGASGELMSDEPLISPRLWVSIFSGKQSKKHGVEFFGNSSSMVKCKRIWDIFNDKGHTVGVFGTFVTWPPAQVKGFMIPSLFALGPETVPEEYRFLQELTLMERKKGKDGMAQSEGRKSLLYYAGKMLSHGVSLSTLFEAGSRLVIDKIKRSSKDERYWKRAVSHMKISAEIFLHLYDRYQPEFATLHMHLCDALSHRYWRYYEPDKFHDVDKRLVKKYGSVIPDSYIEADRMIGKIMKAAGDATVIVLSDHGSGALESTRSSYGLHVENFLNLLKLREQVIPANVGLMTFCYFDDKEFMKSVITRLEKIVFPETDKKLFDVFEEEALIGVRLSDAFWGKEIDGEKRIDLGEFGSCAFSDLFLPQKMEVSGTHIQEGMLVMAGPDIKKNHRIADASIFDITPTVLALAGYPVAADMDGKALTETINEEFLLKNAITSIDSYEESSSERGDKGKKVTYDDIKSSLESLGYL